MPASCRPDFHLPLLTTWNLNLEQQIGKSWVGRIGYHGNKGTFLSSGAKNPREINPAIYIPGQSTTDNTQERRRYQDLREHDRFVGLGVQLPLQFAPIES